MSGRGYVGAQHRGGGGRGGSFGGPPGGGWWNGGYGGRSGHGGFAGIGGGGGGGGRRPWQGGGGPMGHKWEDTRRDGRVQKNSGRGRGGAGRGGGGRGGGRGRGGGARGGARGGGQATANKLNSWVSDQHYQKRVSGAREEPEGVNYDAQLNEVRAEGAPLVTTGMSAVENRQRDRLTNSQASQFVAADVKGGDFLGINLDARNAHSLMDRADRTQPEGTRWNMRLKAVSAEDGAATSDVIKGRFLGAMVSAADPFAFDPNQKGIERGDEDEMDVDPTVQKPSAEEQMEEERRRDGARDPNYEPGKKEYTRRASHYDDV